MKSVVNDTRCIFHTGIVMEKSLHRLCVRERSLCVTYRPTGGCVVDLVCLYKHAGSTRDVDWKITEKMGEYSEGRHDQVAVAAVTHPEPDT